jgi:CubicO group peptidase (beta-lactamase class C family)
MMPGVHRSLPAALLLAALAHPALHASELPDTTRAPGAAGVAGVYYPGPDAEWERRRPEQVGMDARRLEEAVAFARANETRAPRNLEIAHYQSFGREPFGEAIGPFSERGDPAGIVLRNGYIVAEWGDPYRADMTFSVTKSFLSTAVGSRFDRGMIRGLQDPVRGYVGPIAEMGAQATAGRYAADRIGAPMLLSPFESEHNRKITWDHLLRQTSDWQGTLWGKPDWADRPGSDPAEWMTRARHEPGTRYQYNDVRVNVLALAATERLAAPAAAGAARARDGPDRRLAHLALVRLRELLGPLDGQPVQSVSGGGHWGGGMFISARDQARFGYLTLRRGRWNDRQILSEEWIRLATTPTPVQTGYGFMNFFLNTDRTFLPSAPASAFAHMGNGTNMVYVDPENDLVVVARWIERNQIDGLVQRVIAAVR